MTAQPRICFGQQPCGFFPRRFLAAKIRTARRLQAELGGEIVFFYHDSDHDPRETQTILRNRTSGQAAKLNFSFENKVQKKWSPLYVKRIPSGWKEPTLRQLPAFAEPAAVEAFRGAAGATVADFCLDAYARLGLLRGLTVVRSSDPQGRKEACAVTDFFVDLPYEGEIVRARWTGAGFRLHEGGDVFVDLPARPFGKEQVSPSRDSRLRWMQSIVRCTHYVAGAGEQAYLHPEEAPDVVFVPREPIERSDEAYAEVFE